MSFAFSFGRMGLDFRQFVHFEFTKTIIDFFQTKIVQATKRFKNYKLILTLIIKFYGQNKTSFAGQ